MWCSPCCACVRLANLELVKASLPSMRHTDHMSNIAQTEFQQLVRHDASCIAEPKQAMISKHSMQTHRPSVQQRFKGEIAERGMAVDDLNLLPDEDLP